MKSVSHEEWLIKKLKDPEYSSIYLMEALKDGNQDVIHLALQDVLKANGYIIMKEQEVA
jgi:DNA-binding phage protein